MFSSCCEKTGLCKVFCPKPVHFVAGLIFFVAGLTKIMGVMMPVSQMATMMGGAPLSLLGFDPTHYASLALCLGWIAIIIELVGGLSFMTGCCKTSRYAAVGLTIVSGVILLNEIKGAFAKDLGILQVFQSVQFTLLFFTVFATEALKFICHCCKSECSSSCSTSCCMEAKK